MTISRYGLFDLIKLRKSPHVEQIAEAQLLVADTELPFVGHRAAAQVRSKLSTVSDDAPNPLMQG